MEETSEEIHIMRPNHLGHLSPRRITRSKHSHLLFSASLQPEFILSSRHGLQALGTRASFLSPDGLKTPEGPRTYIPCSPKHTQIFKPEGNRATA